MKKQRGLVLTCAWAITAASLAAEPKNPTSPSVPDARQQILHLGEEWVAAEVKHDAATLDRILDDKFLATFGSKRPYNKPAFI